MKSIIEACNVYGVRLDNICHVMIDGARYNEVAVDALNFATSVGISKECEDHDSDMEQDAGREYEADDAYFHVVQTALNNELRSARPLLCHGHVMMIRINRALKAFNWKGTVACDLTMLLSQMLYGGVRAKAVLCASF